ncbi:MAG: photosynthetic complex assembly protein PuhC [Rubrivivax sp.]|jgi:putative photosynthetic complex assembly protein|nr:photosynthetic complex assembly protein PuhC [Betaproteobacteria bacterium]MBP6316679.1 photosynthetic complex assembly protein PuhC [Rubrivivax sp.]MBK7460142.1 photosynthetic complex assembly protein PuhC [Betaproteobacteria bacterium]MBK7515163.1 photosynthetic complex assembly protein PuhC [Betaproteobacteria bacterium]MBK9685699.1 photosynthetic complex assembly protein PuhC [Betaproteobacteria bacterium]
MPAVNTAVPAAPAADTMPRGPLMAIGALLLVTLVGVAAVRLSGADIREPDAAAVATRSLRFEDRPDGSVAVLDAVSGRQFHAIQGEAGFLRGALRAMARERRKQGLGSAPAFELIARADGRLTLSDPATGERVDLESFGPTNAGAFAQLLTARPVAAR